MNTEDTYQITCPYCGYEDKDSWEFRGDDGEEDEVICPSCEETMLCSRNITVTYSTRKTETKK